MPGDQRIINLAIQLDLRVTDFSLTHRLSDLSLLTTSLPPRAPHANRFVTAG